MGNICGLYPKTNKTKTNYLYDTASSENAKIIVLTESHLSSDVKDCEIQMDGFDVHRCDRAIRSHGGVVVYTHKDVKGDKILEISNSQCELIAVLVKKLKCLILGLYRPPQSQHCLLR